MNEHRNESRTEQQLSYQQVELLLSIYAHSRARRSHSNKTKFASNNILYNYQMKNPHALWASHLMLDSDSILLRVEICVFWSVLLNEKRSTFFLSN